MNRPLCFVLMPFGKKEYNNILVDYDKIYNDLIIPALVSTGLEPIRADEEITGGMIHKTMFERLILCEYAIADLSFSNANVFYELGVRHAVRPYKTILLFSSLSELPFDVRNQQALSYGIEKSGELKDLENDRNKLINKINKIKNETFTDSPLFQLFDELRPQELDHQKTDLFRERVKYSNQIKEELALARKISADKVQEIENSIGDLNEENSGIVIDIFLSYRATKAWKKMINLFDKMPKPLAERKMIQEQLAFALNRDGHSKKAETVLLSVLQKYGASSETYGLLGRVYKDCWENEKDKLIAGEYLNKAIETYYLGFKSDSRDAYPGINCVTLMEIKSPPDERRTGLLPIVEFAVITKVEKGRADYWDYATLLELYVLMNKEQEANKMLPKVLIEIREPFEPETTARNLKLIREARMKTKANNKWIAEIESALLSHG